MQVGGGGPGEEVSAADTLCPPRTVDLKTNRDRARGRLVSVHVLRLEAQMPKNNEFLHRCMFLLRRGRRIDRNQLQPK